MTVCPGCGADLRFDAASQQMKCDCCGCFYDPCELDGTRDDVGFPISPTRFLLASLSVSALVFAVLYFFIPLKPAWTLILTNLLLVLGVGMCRRQLKRISKRPPDREASALRASFLRSQRIATVLSVPALVASAVILLLDPIDHAVFYAACIPEALILFFLIHRAFRFRLQLAALRPPQFGGKGGRDDA